MPGGLWIWLARRVEGNVLEELSFSTGRTVVVSSIKTTTTTTTKPLEVNQNFLKIQKKEKKRKHVITKFHSDKCYRCGDVNAHGVRTRHGNLHCSFPGGVRAHHSLFRVRAFETPTYYIVAKRHWTLQWFIWANQKTSPSLLLINVDITPSIFNLFCGSFVQWITK